MTEMISGYDPISNTEEVYSDEVLFEEGSDEFDAPEVPSHCGVDF